MRLKLDKINHLAHIVAQGMEAGDWCTLLKDRNEVRLRTKELILQEMKLDDVVNAIARDKIESLQRKVPEGSREWEVLYQKYYEEEMTKRRR